MHYADPSVGPSILRTLAAFVAQRALSRPSQKMSRDLRPSGLQGQLSYFGEPRLADDSRECTEDVYEVSLREATLIAQIRSWSGFREEGQALVELASVSSILLVVVTGILVFGIFEMQIMSLTEGVNSAGRVLAVSAGLTLDPCNTAAQAVQSAAPLLSSSNLSYQIVLNPTPSLGSSTNQTFPGASCSSTSTTTGAPEALVSGGTVTVTATDSNCSLKFFGNNLMPNGCQISQSITETVQ